MTTEEETIYQPIKKPENYRPIPKTHSQNEIKAESINLNEIVPQCTKITLEDNYLFKNQILYHKQPNYYKISVFDIIIYISGLFVILSNSFFGKYCRNVSYLIGFLIFNGFILLLYIFCRVYIFQEKKNLKFRRSIFDGVVAGIMTFMILVTVFNYLLVFDVLKIPLYDL